MEHTGQSRRELTAKIEPFDSFWEGPHDVEKGYRTFAQFYRHNYLPHLPQDRQAQILVVSCGPGYFVELLHQEGYAQVQGIDSDASKVEHARKRNLNCQVAHAFEFLAEQSGQFDVIICEQELNHLTKTEMVEFLRLCWQTLRPQGMLVVHALNGANPLTGADALAQNFDHYNTCTPYSLTQVLTYSGFTEVTVLPLNLYVFYRNPFNYVAMLAAALASWIFRLSFILYGKSNWIFTKKIGSVARKLP